MLELFKVGHVIFRETMAAVSHYRKRYEDIVGDENVTQSECQTNTEEGDNSFESQMNTGIGTIRKWVHIFLPACIEGVIHGLAHVTGCISNKLRDITKTVADKTCEVFRNTVEESFVRFRDHQQSQNT